MTAGRSVSAPAATMLITTSVATISKRVTPLWALCSLWLAACLIIAVS